MIAEAGRGVVVLLRDWRTDRPVGPDPPRPRAARPSPELRDYGIGAQILADLGVRA